MSIQNVANEIFRTLALGMSCVCVLCVCRSAMIWNMKCGQIRQWGRGRGHDGWSETLAWRTQGVLFGWKKGKIVF